MNRLISIFMIIIFMVSTTGCKKTKQEIDHLSIALAIGYDLTPENKYIVTIQILNNEKQTSIRKQVAPEESRTSDVVIYSTEGFSPRDALNNLSTKMGRKIFFGHLKCIVISSDLAEYGLSFFVDVLQRGQESRPDSLMLVTKGKAADVVNTQIERETIPANSIDYLKKQQIFKGFAPIVSRLDFANSLFRKAEAPIIGVIEIVKDGSHTFFKMAGTAVFKKDKLIGYLDMHQTQGMQWIKGKVQDTSITVPLDEKELITFDLLRAKSKVTVSIIDDKITIYINIKNHANVLELSESINFMENPDSMKELSNILDSAIKSRIQSALHAAQKELNADIFQFGSLVYKTYPKYWKKIEDDWGNIFPDIEVKIDVNSTLKRPGIINKPIGK